jgi:AraC-like DNA-binding protein
MQIARQFGCAARRRLMPTSGTSTYSDPEDYQSNVRGARINLTFACYGEFRARLSWVEFRHLHLLRSQESLPRIAYVALAPERVFITFPTQPDPPPIWGGVKLGSGDILLHGRGERMHQRTSAASRWGSVSLAPEHLAAYGKTLAGLDLVAPPVGRVLRPPKLAKAQLLRLHAQACRLAETKAEIIAHREVNRALEQDLVHALVNCLAAGDAHGPTAARRYHWDIMARFEEALAAHFDRPLQMPDLCAAIGVPERTLRMCCSEVLGMGPSRYLRLRRLNMVRAELRRADPATASVAGLAMRHGFSELGRFAAIYRTVFGETPSGTLWRRRSLARDAASAESA